MRAPSSRITVLAFLGGALVMLILLYGDLLAGHVLAPYLHVCS